MMQINATNSNSSCILCSPFSILCSAADISLWALLAGDSMVLGLSLMVVPGVGPENPEQSCYDGYGPRIQRTFSATHGRGPHSLGT